MKKRSTKTQMLIIFIGALALSFCFYCGLNTSVKGAPICKHDDIVHLFKVIAIIMGFVFSIVGIIYTIIRYNKKEYKRIISFIIIGAYLIPLLLYGSAVVIRNNDLNNDNSINDVCEIPGTQWNKVE